MFYCFSKNATVIFEFRDVYLESTSKVILNWAATVGVVDSKVQKKNLLNC